MFVHAAWKPFWETDLLPHQTQYCWANIASASNIIFAAFDMRIVVQSPTEYSSDSGTGCESHAPGIKGI